MFLSIQNKLILLALAGLFLAALASRPIITNKQLKQEIINELTDQEKNVSSFKQQIEDEDIIIFLGNTKSGKSTIVNYLIGTPLQAWDPLGMLDFKIIKQDGRSDGPEIGHNSLSCTTIPKVYPVLGSTNVIVDLPGLDDNRGVVQNIINALYINQIKHAKSVKFVIVFDVNELIIDNINSFLDSLQYVEQLLHKFGEIRSFVCAIFTKVPPNFTSEHITKLLKNKILDGQINVDKELIETITKNPELIGMFRRPTGSGYVSSELDVNIRSAIKQTTAAKMSEHEIILTVSDEAKGALLMIYPEYTDSNYFKKEVDQILTKYSDYSLDNWAFASYDDELNTTKLALEKIKYSVQASIDTPSNDLKDIQKSLQTIQESPICEQFLVNFKVAVMLDQSVIMDERHKKAVIQSYHNSLSLLLNSINNLLQKIDAEIETRRVYYIKYTSKGAAIDIANSAINAIESGLLDPAKNFISGGVEFAEHLNKGEVGMIIEGLSRLGPQVAEKVSGYEVLSPSVKSIGFRQIAAETQVILGEFLSSPIGISTGTFTAGGASYAAYVMYTDRYGKRNDARKLQGRQ